jgi:hypothetical protein
MDVCSSPTDPPTSAQTRSLGRVCWGLKGLNPSLAHPRGDSSNPLFVALEELESALADDFQLFAKFPEP